MTSCDRVATRLNRSETAVGATLKKSIVGARPHLRADGISRAELHYTRGLPLGRVARVRRRGTRERRVRAHRRGGLILIDGKTGGPTWLVGNLPRSSLRWLSITGLKTNADISYWRRARVEVAGEPRAGAGAATSRTETSGVVLRTRTSTRVG